MAIYRKTWEQLLPVSPGEAWRFLSNPANLAQITPPEMGFRIIDPGLPENIYRGMIIRYRVKVLPLVRVQWVTEISHMEDGRYFVDRQLSGPYRIWHHEHHIEEAEGGVMMRDILTYSPPMGIFGAIANRLFIGRRIEEIFSFRERVLSRLFPGYISKS